ncbi:hypothetical protein PMM47T1_08636 [Pseudomonas sp. M47T1]|uniref:hypothetical protein n=1 Tax=unclassified Pseudomonas TaxID=196821 RepID=UPI0002607D52|nr:hypothetical protein [Pseudomonas sp. M47T1]EIK97195.1 hypothetical protein PMM47T1_08636 [Pseudomonas sp. M47T1]
MRAIVAAPILKALDEQLEAIEFDPLVPSSVDQVIEASFAPFSTHPILGPMAASSALPPGCCLFVCLPAP